MSTPESTRIVVGVDGSAHSARALAWAIDEAKLRGAQLELVTAWHVPAMIYGAPGFTPSLSPPPDESFRTASDKIVEDAARGARDAGLDVETSVRQGQAADVLVEAASDADLLVVGSRGHGGFAGLLLGSVSAQCSQHAPCPVVIVR